MGERMINDRKQDLKNYQSEDGNGYGVQMRRYRAETPTVQRKCVCALQEYLVYKKWLTGLAKMTRLACFNLCGWLSKGRRRGRIEGEHKNYGSQSEQGGYQARSLGADRYGLQGNKDAD